MGLEELLRLTVSALMQATGQSQRDLAAVLGLTQTQVSRRQSGSTAWSLRDCDALAEHFGIAPLDLLAGPTRACEALPARARAVDTTARADGMKTEAAVRAHQVKAEGAGR
ncbi:helix-turn-helix domain-containing protein [Streptomyces sp. NPDC059070]|uniref:helix-turn-helix domain-containing protein n=1 Tax=Streptomyces sp. NPDC059070 TaxID=3346713 RepID=UPI0036BAE528